MFDLVVFVWQPTTVRLSRLKKREIARYGPGIEDPNDPRHRGHQEFLSWAAAYDTGGRDMRSKSKHEEWITALTCPVVRIEQCRTVEENLKVVLKEIGSTDLIIHTGRSRDATGSSDARPLYVWGGAGCPALRRLHDGFRPRSSEGHAGGVCGCAGPSLKGRDGDAQNRLVRAQRRPAATASLHPSKGTHGGGLRGFSNWCTHSR